VFGNGIDLSQLILPMDGQIEVLKIAIIIGFNDIYNINGD